MNKFLKIVVVAFACGQISAQVQLKNKLTHYFRDFNTIEGWFSKSFVDVIACISDAQTKMNIQGNIAEIGVYHGKSFIPLYALAGKDELVLAVDCFDQQEFNYDLSGTNCKYNAFVNNLKKYVDAKVSKLKVLKGDSSKLHGSDLLKATNGEKFRIFSIDGCHRAKETMIDLANAVEVLANGGVIIIDDFFNQDWPGVSEGLCRYLVSNENIKPFFVGYNKILLAHQSFAQKYMEILKTTIKCRKDALFFGSTVAIY